MRIELSIEVDYCPTWDRWEGVRELIQNALDVRDKHGKRISIRYEAGALHITTHGVKLSLDALLIGHSTKRGDDTQRGEHGEGLDIGLLALVRAGVKVNAWNSDETWRFSIEQSKTFSAKVFTIYTRSMKKSIDAFELRVEITESEWEAMKPRFIDLVPPKKMVRAPRTKTAWGSWNDLRGSVIFDEDRRGDVYCRGIWVAKHDDLQYGYDLLGVKLDRDRRLIEDYHFRYELARTWVDLIVSEPEVYVPMAYESLARDDEMRDFVALGDELDMHTSEHHKDAVGTAFSKEFEERNQSSGRTYPVRDESDAKRLRQYGYEGTTVPNRLHKVLKLKYGEPREIIDRVSKGAHTNVTSLQLNAAERETLWRGVAMLSVSCSLVTESYQELWPHCLAVVEFEDDEIHGTYDSGSGIIRIARHRLGRLECFLSTMIHHVSHHVSRGLEGSVPQVAAERLIWEGVMGFTLGHVSALDEAAMGIGEKVFELRHAVDTVRT